MNTEPVPPREDPEEIKKTENQEQSPQELGGHARAQKLTPEERSEIARTAAERRWEANGGLVTYRASHAGDFTLGSLVLPCAVLEDGTRIITSAGLMKAIGRPWKGTYRGNRPNFLSGSNLEPFIDDELKGLLNQIEYRVPAGGYARGYKAEILPKVCEVYLRARDANALTPNQVSIAQAAYIVMRGLAHIGIIALIDEATGYQEVRDRLALQKILERFISKELLKWVKRFPDDFYFEMFRLKNWEWKGMKVNRPSVVGHYTNDLIYDRLAPGVLEELRKMNPPDDQGKRKHKHHQWLTNDVGHPKLRDHINGIMALMRASSTWEQFKRMTDRAYPKLNTTMALPLGDEPTP